MRIVKELEHKRYLKNNQLHIAQWRILLTIIFLYLLLLLCCSPVHVTHPAPSYEIKLRSSESSGGSANKGYILVDNDLYHFPSEVFLEEGSHIISFVPEGDYNFSYWELIGIEATPPKDEFDNPTLLSINGSGEVIAYYDLGEQLEISRVGEPGNPIFADSPIDLNVNITFNGKPVPFKDSS